MRSDSGRERSLIEGSESMVGWRLGATRASDGAAFNRLLCLSQLCYIIASNTWPNTALGKFSVHAVVGGIQSKDTGVVAGWGLVVGRQRVTSCQPKDPGSSGRCNLESAYGL